MKQNLDEMMKLLELAKGVKEVFGEDLFNKVFTEEISKEVEKKDDVKFEVGDRVLVDDGFIHHKEGMVLYHIPNDDSYLVGLDDNGGWAHNGEGFVPKDYVKNNFPQYLNKCSWCLDSGLKKLSEQPKEEPKPVFPKYKVGDTVKVRKDLVLFTEWYGAQTVVPPMVEHDIVTIKEVLDNDRGYNVEESIYIYTDEMLDGLAPKKESKPKPKFKVGDKVLFKEDNDGKGYVGVVIYINRESNTYTLGMLEDNPRMHDGMQRWNGIDDICHVRKKFRHFIRDERCRWALESELELYEEPKLKVGDEVWIKSEITNIDESSLPYQIKLGAVGRTWVGKDLEIKKVND